MTARLAYDRELIGTAEVARRLGLSRDNFYKNHRRLVRDQGFPAPVLPRRWDPKAIELWLDAQLPRHLQTGDLAGDVGLEARGALIAQGVDPDAFDRRPGATNTFAKDSMK